MSQLLFHIEQQFFNVVKVYNVVIESKVLGPQIHFGSKQTYTYIRLNFSIRPILSEISPDPNKKKFLPRNLSKHTDE